eukprot:1161744-Pelagomonas_calceolata.AAC.3
MSTPHFFGRVLMVGKRHEFVPETGGLGPSLAHRAASSHHICRQRTQQEQQAMHKAGELRLTHSAHSRTMPASNICSTYEAGRAILKIWELRLIHSATFCTRLASSIYRAVQLHKHVLFMYSISEGVTIGAIRAQPFDAGLFFVCLWDSLYEEFGGRCPHVHVTVRGRESTVC